MKLEYALVIVLSVALVIAALIVFFSNKEQKKQTKELVDKTRMDWAKAFDAADMLHKREVSALDRYIVSLQDLVEEKNERIKQLENDIALKDMVMACAKIDGSVDYDKLSEMAKTSKINWSR